MNSNQTRYSSYLLRCTMIVSVALSCFMSQSSCTQDQSIENPKPIKISPKSKNERGTTPEDKVKVSHHKHLDPWEKKEIAKSYRIDSFAERLESLEKLPEEQIDKEIETYYRVFSYRSFCMESEKHTNMMTLCQEASRNNKTNILHSLLRLAKNVRAREELLLSCGLPSSMRQDWAETIDFKEKTHLIGLIAYLENPKIMAKVVIADSEYGTQARCIASGILGRNGAREDLIFLRKHYGKINPQKVKFTIKGIAAEGQLPGYRFANIDDCAKEAARILETRLDLK